MQECFPIYPGSCTEYEGNRYPDTINIPEGVSVQEAIEHTINYFLRNSSTSGTARNIDMSQLEGVPSECSGKLRDVSFSYEAKGTTSGGTFSYNYTKTVDSLPANFNVIREGIEVVTKSGQISTLKGGINGANFPANAFPLNVSFYLDINTPCGLVRLSKNVTVPLPNENVTTDFVVQDFGSQDYQTPKTEREAIQTLIGMVQSISKKVDNRTSTRDGKSLNEILLNVESNYTTLTNNLESIPTVNPQDIADIKEHIINLTKSVQNLTQENATLKLQVEQLQRDTKIT